MHIQAPRIPRAAESRSGARTAAAVAVFCLATGAVAKAQSVRLNPPFAPAIDGDVEAFLVSPTGTHVVFRADATFGTASELFSRPIDGAQRVVPLNVVEPCLGALAFAISPDGSTVVYLADEEVSGRAELYRLPLVGGESLKISGPLPAQGSVVDFRVSPDGASVVYRADQDSGGVVELYGVPISGGVAPVKLSGPMQAGGDVFEYRIAPDSARVVYGADQETDEVHELYSVPITGGATPLKLSGPLQALGDVVEFEISPDSARVVYLADQDVDEIHELYSVPIAGGAAPVDLNGPIQSVNGVFEFDISPDSTRVVYRAEQESFSIELYSVPIAGGVAPVELNVSIPPQHPGDVLVFEVSPDSAYVVYITNQSSLAREVYSVPIGGGGPVRLNGQLVSFGGVLEFAFTPDAATVVYRADQNTDGQFELFRAPIAGGVPAVVISGPLQPSTSVHEFAISPDGASVVYRADHDVEDVLELYRVPLLGGAAPIKLSGPLAPGGAVAADFAIGPDSARVVYRADGQTTGVMELYSASIAGGPSALLNDALSVVGTGSAERAELDPSGQWAVYRADQDTAGIEELYVVPVDGSMTSLKLNPVLATGPTVALPGVPDFVLGPAGTQRVVFRANQHGEKLELYSSRVVAPLHLAALSGQLAHPNSDVENDYRVSSDGAFVVYRADQEANNRMELYSVPLAGGAPPVNLNPNLPPGGDVTWFLLSPDGAFVVYRADQEINDLFEFYSVPIAGGQAPAKLSGALTDLVFDFSISPDSTWVVFSSLPYNPANLYVVPITGGTPQPLTQILVPGGNVISYRHRITPDSARVVYLADQEVNGLVELYVVPITGGAAVKLNGPLLGGSVSRFTISPDGLSVVYVAAQEVFDRSELYVVPITGGVPPVKLSGPLVPGGDVVQAEIDPQGVHVVYSADQDTDGLVEVYSVPIAGGLPPVKLSKPAPGVPPTAPVPFFQFLFTSDGQVVYGAQHDTLGVDELYRAPLDGSSPAVKVSVPIPGCAAGVRSFELSDDGTTALYVAEVEYATEVFAGSVCGGEVLAYCTGKTSSLGCVPFVTASGVPSATATAAFSLRAADLIPNEAGYFFYGFKKGNLSFHGGKLCVKSPFERWLPVKTAGATGTPPCSGVLARNFNARIQSGVDPLLTPGSVVFAQFTQRDPGAPGGFPDTLTDGIRFRICP